MTPSNRILALLALVSLGAGAATALVLDSSRDDAARVERLEDRIEKLTELVESAPRVEERRTIVERTTVAAPQAFVPGVQPASERSEEAAVEDLPEDDGPSAEDRDAYAQTVFEREPVDASWASVAKDQLDAALAPHLGESTLRNLECRSALCRAEVDHASQQEYQAFLDGVIGHSRDVWRGPMGMYRVGEDETGRVALNLYFARPGAELPHLN